MIRDKIYQKLKTGDLFLVISKFNSDTRNYYLVIKITGDGVYKEVYTRLSNNRGIHRFTCDSLGFTSDMFSVKLITNLKEIEVIKTLYFTKEQL